jgi:transcriptional regulator with XRE-family HTH domain
MVVDTLAAFNRRLRERREAAGLTQGEAAAAIGYGQQYISNLERGQNQPGVLVLVAKLARAYSTSVDYLLGLVDDPSPNAGAQWPAHGRELIAVLERMSESRRVELLSIAETLAATEAKRAEESAQIERMAEMLEALLPEGRMSVLTTILEASVATGDIATARRDIVRLLGEEQKAERQRQE